MATDDPLSVLLLRWQEMYEGQGRDVPAGELCRDRPELAPELQRQIDIVKRLSGLASETRVAPPAEPADPKTRTIHPNPAAPTPAAPLPTWLQMALDAPTGSGEAGRLGRFRIIRVLGEGGMGTVLLAEDPLAARRVALKVMKPGLVDRPDARARFVREARAAAALEHDNVVPVYHVDEIQGMPYIVMPLLQGENLEDRLKREPRLPLALTVQVGREVAEGLAAAHAAGLIHRDVKPANLWLEPRPGGAVRVRVLDFGLARPLEAGEPITESGAVLGTPAYMAPEQASGAKLRPTADLFSLGAVLYRMATGRHAFDGPTLPALLRSVAETDPPPPHEVHPDVPRDLSDLITTLLAKDPARRPRSARAVADALADIATGQPVVPTPETLTWPKAAPDWRKRIWAGIGVAVAAGFLAVLLGPGLFPRDDGAGKTNGPVHPVPLTGELTVRFGTLDEWLKKGKANRTGRIQDVNALPLRPGEGIRVEVAMSEPAYVYLVWLDGQGNETLLFPWDPLARPPPDLRIPPPKAPPCKELTSTPKDGGLWEMEGESGLETILLLARRAEPLGANVNLAELIKLPKTPLENPRELVMRGLNNGKPLPAEDQNRRPEAPKIDAPFMRMLEHLGEHFEVVRAVRFAYQK